MRTTRSFHIPCRAPVLPFLAFRLVSFARAHLNKGNESRCKTVRTISAPQTVDSGTASDPQFARREAACFQRGRERVEPRILVLPPVVSKVYPPDQHIRRFLGQWIQTLAAAAGNPFLTTGS